MEKKRFLSGIARMREGGVYPCPNFLALYSRSAFLVNKKSPFLQKCQCIEPLTVFRLLIYLPPLPTFCRDLHCIEFWRPKKKDQVARIGVRWGGGLGDSGNARKKTFFFLLMSSLSINQLSWLTEWTKDDSIPCRSDCHLTSYFTTVTSSEFRCPYRLVNQFH